MRTVRTKSWVQIGAKGATLWQMERRYIYIYIYMIIIIMIIIIIIIVSALSALVSIPLDDFRC